MPFEATIFHSGRSNAWMCQCEKKRERMLRKHKMGGRDGEMDKCKWRE